MNPKNKTHRKTALIVGVLYIIGTISGILSLSFSDAVRNAQYQLIQVSTDETQIIIAALCVLTMGLALTLVPVMMYPVLKKSNPVLAWGYVVFRSGLEAMGYILTTVSWLLLVPLSRAYIAANTTDVALLESLGAILFAGDELGSVLNIVFSLGATMFYMALFRAKLIPRWLSGWGLLALIFYFASGLLGMFNIIDPLSSAGVVMQLPLALQEMVLAVWLIVKGFDLDIHNA